jgi:hypothetical protein
VASSCSSWVRRRAARRRSASWEAANGRSRPTGSSRSGAVGRGAAARRRRRRRRRGSAEEPAAT